MRLLSSNATVRHTLVSGETKADIVNLPQCPYRVREGRFSVRQRNTQDPYRGKCDRGPTSQVSLSLGGYTLSFTGQWRVKSRSNYRRI